MSRNASRNSGPKSGSASTPTRFETAQIWSVRIFLEGFSAPAQYRMTAEEYRKLLDAVFGDNPPHYYQFLVVNETTDDAYQVSLFPRRVFSIAAKPIP